MSSSLLVAGGGSESGLWGGAEPGGTWYDIFSPNEGGGVFAHVFSNHQAGRSDSENYDFVSDRDWRLALPSVLVGPARLAGVSNTAITVEQCQCLA